ncbi:pyridoxal phosphate-dependent aminotransferase [Micromonospora lupini]|uniref:pyridoxal phosphate-dependent aminotransferase n=1 Tax=Micromonospora lupini TaxID=285679 RepID=UPI0031D80750
MLSGPPSREELLDLARGSGSALLDLSLGVPADPPPPTAGGSSGQEPAGYPPSAGTEELRLAAAGYLRRRFGVALAPDAVAACAGAKEFISTLPLFLRDAGLVPPGRDTVLIPRLCYPAYENGARLAGFATYRVPADDDHRMRPDLLPASVRDRALCLWVNSPSNPTGALEPLDTLVDWGRRYGVLVVSDEAYTESTWCGSPRTALAHGVDGVLAVHSLSKRSNSPGLRVGFYAGDPAVVGRLVPCRRAAGLMAGAVAQRSAAYLLGDDEHARVQYERGATRVADLVRLLTANGAAARSPDGGFFVWTAAPDGDGDAWARSLAGRAGIVVMPGGAYGPAGRGHVRFAAVRDIAEITSRAWALGPLDSDRRRGAHV